MGSTSYDIKVLAYDSDDNNSVFSNEVTGTTIAGVDITPPNAVTDLSSPPQGNEQAILTMTWTKPFDNVGVVGYDIHLNQSYYESVGDVTTHSITGLSTGTTHRIAIFAKDLAGNISAVSNVVDTTIEQ